ncbi:hypothetical protein AB4Z19_13475 [Pseudoduganella sp. RAF19]|jgi:hypothetical protein|uniref:hypothetical protein n=2 Tax=unclassified Pseudoduganella TaxID=2637179 RepID=UPI003F9BCF06
MKNYIAALVLCLIADAASACKVPAVASDMQAYLRSNNMPKVVLKGKVAEVTEMLRQGGVVEQRIEIETSSWWRGEATPTITMMTSSGAMSGTSCEGVWDFSVKVGEEWLIVGVINDGIVHPLPKLSTKIVDGKVPPQLLKVLGRGRTAS